MVDHNFSTHLSWSYEGHLRPALSEAFKEYSSKALNIEDGFRGPEKIGRLICITG